MPQTEMQRFAKLIQMSEQDQYLKFYLNLQSLGVSLQGIKEQLKSATCAVNTSKDSAKPCQTDGWKLVS